MSEGIHAMTISAPLPQFYQHPVVLNRERNADLTISESTSRYAFAVNAQMVIIADVEFFDTCRQFPIIFATTTDGRLFPLALMGLENGENLFVDKDGYWLGSYIPAYIRRYPFITAEGDDGQMAVCCDAAFDGFNREGGTALFKDGEPTAKANEIMSFLKDYYQRMKATEAFCVGLAQGKLLRQIDAQANLADGRSYALNGMLVVDEQRLTQLPDVDVVRLYRSGMMALINAHLVSLRNLGVLIDRKAARR